MTLVNAKCLEVVKAAFTRSLLYRTSNEVTDQSCLVMRGPSDGGPDGNGFDVLVWDPGDTYIRSSDL